MRLTFGFISTGTTDLVALAHTWFHSCAGTGMPLSSGTRLPAYMGAAQDGAATKLYQVP